MGADGERWNVTVGQGDNLAVRPLVLQVAGHPLRESYFLRLGVSRGSRSSEDAAEQHQRCDCTNKKVSHRFLPLTSVCPM
ncbi:MAG TPA: hypothetical protein VF303_01945 [Candidatus Nanoarchaeia archaeon]